MNSLIAEKKQNLPILIIDRKGIIGEKLAEHLINDTQIVLATAKEINSEKIILIGYGNRPPIIPDSVYSHIFLVDDEEPITRELIDSLFKKAREDRSLFIVITGIKNQEIIGEEILDYKESKAVFLGDLVDRNVYPTQVSRILNQARARGKIIIPGDGLTLIYPLFFQDAIYGILEASFGTAKDKKFYLFPRYGISLLSFSHLIQKANPEINIDFKDEEKTEDIKIEKEGRYLLDENYPLEEKIRNFKIEISKIKGDLGSMPDVNRDYSGKAITRNIKIIAFFLLLFVSLPLISTLLLSFLGLMFLNTGKLGLKSLDIDLSGKYIATSQYFLGLSDKTAKLLVGETFGLDLSRRFENNILENYNYAQGFNDFFQAINYYSEGNVGPAVNSFKNFILFSQRQKAKKNTVDFLPEYLLNIASGTIDTWPQILGFEGEKKYLLLFQNSDIIRPQGGIITAYALVTLNKGKVKNISIGSTGDLDKQLKGHVEPPFPIRRYMGLKDWHFLDSNFNPSFVEAAQDSSYLFSLETEQKPDAILGLDSNFIKSLLAATGNLNVDKYGGVNESNFLNLSKQYSQDPAFLSEVVKNINIVLKDKKLSFAPLIRGLGNDIKHKDIMIAFPQTNIQNSFTVNGLSNSFWDGRNNSSRNINDFLSLSESNFGTANKLIERDISHDISIADDGGIDLSTEVKLKNEGDDTYKAYLRFIVPNAVILKNLKLDNKDTDYIEAQTDPNIYEDKNYKPLQAEVEKGTVSGKTLFGFYIEIPKGQNKILKISYMLSQTLASYLNDFSYSFLFYKQPGIDFYPLRFGISYPKAFRILSFPRKVAGENSSAAFSADVSNDTTINLDFSKK